MYDMVIWLARTVTVVLYWWSQSVQVPLCLPYYRPKRKKGLGGPPLLILIYQNKTKQNKTKPILKCVFILFLLDFF